MQSLEMCPVCGDDGTASPASRAAWAASGQRGEPPYWSGRRMLIALGLIIVFVVGGMIIGANTKP